MKKIKIINLSYFLILIFLFATSACKTYKVSNVASTAAFYDYEVEHISTGEGIETVKVYSYGKNKSDGVQLGKLNALRAIIFKGIPKADYQKPIISEAGAEEKYKSYFNEFFKDGGKYLKFISLTNNNVEVLDGSDRLKIGIIVTIQKNNLRKELEAAKIIKSLNNGF
jgi:hypothetical protein